MGLLCQGTAETGTEIRTTICVFFTSLIPEGSPDGSSITWNLLEIQIPMPHLRPTESGSLGVGPSNLCLNKSSNMLKLEKICAGVSTPQQATECPAAGEKKWGGVGGGGLPLIKVHELYAKAK